MTQTVESTITDHTFNLEAGRATKQFSRILNRSLSEREIDRVLYEMLAVIEFYENQLFEYRNGRAYPRNVLMNRTEFLEKLKK